MQRGERRATSENREREQRREEKSAEVLAERERVTTSLKRVVACEEKELNSVHPEIESGAGINDGGSDTGN